MVNKAEEFHRQSLGDFLNEGNHEKFNKNVNN